MPQNKPLQKYIDKKLLHKNFLLKILDTKIIVAKKIHKNVCGFIFATSFFALQLFVSEMFVHLFLVAKKQHTLK